MYIPCRLLLVLLVLASSDVVSAVHWDYSGEIDPPHWADYYTKCSGARQSPIDIETEDVTYNSSLKGFQFTNFDNGDSSIKWTLNNNGHTGVVTVNGVMTVTGGGLNGLYQVAQFHFHWGENSSDGSEHVINERHYPMELHIVSYKVAYGNLTNAQNYWDGLAAFGVFLEVEEEEHETFDKLVSMLPEIHEENVPVTIDAFNLTAVLPTDTSKYYRYLGSLTTPPCSEVVVWTVFRQTIKVSEEQIAEFRKLNTGEHNHPHPLKNNCRPVQPTNGRRVMASFLRVAEDEESDEDTRGEQLSSMEADD